MLKLIKKLIGIKPDEPHTAFCQHQQDQKYKWLELARKAEWEADNELMKKQDAAYLGTEFTAYYGTYEEWVAESRRSCTVMYPVNMSQSALAAQSGYYAPYSQFGGAGAQIMRGFGL